MKVTYNPDEDKLRILFCNAPIQESEAHRAGLILDYDQNGRIVGLELSGASAHISRPHTVDFAERSPEGDLTASR
ncbi:hypothetical protein CCAX7_006460 [Capsulimonas corticalis]|uniref:Uncharacterized protein n=1 Tax=Capsulimonas corticalis TaxID=2219043 RepID=A0A402D1D2_9BACT|nr:DUF2283 domain-containing protein [Capsulimonas corticalis]BDI28595.1 hypothetical protein CCAX7_006460 [Capsulimonas corticalis]